MNLPEKQSEEFVNRYIDRYGQKDEKGELVLPVTIPIIPASKQREEILEWAKTIADIVGKKANTTYKYRETSSGRKRETWYEKTFNSLYLQYGPTFKEEDGSPAKEHLWLDDVIDIKKFLKTGVIEQC